MVGYEFIAGQRCPGEVWPLPVEAVNGLQPTVGVLGKGEVVFNDDRQLLIICRRSAVDPLTANSRVTLLNVDSGRTASPVEGLRHLNRLFVYPSTLGTIDPDLKNGLVAVQFQRVDASKRLE